MELDTIRHNTQIEVKQRKRQQAEYKLTGKMKHQVGHTLFAVNTKTLQIKKAEFKKESYITWEEALHVYNGGKTKRSVVTEKDYVYVEALNEGMR